jgi:hypothetical protein
MICFQTKNPNLGKFWKALYVMENAGIFYSHLEYFTVIWYILYPFVNVVVIWYILPRFGILCQEKSGNPAGNIQRPTLGKVATRKIVIFWLKLELTTPELQMSSPDRLLNFCAVTFFRIFFIDIRKCIKRGIERCFDDC